MKVSELKTEMDAQFDHVKEQFRDVDRRFEQVDARFDSLERRIDERHEDAKRYMKMLADDLASRMDTVIEGFSTATRRVDQLEGARDTTFAVLDEHETRIQALERRRR